MIGLQFSSWKRHEFFLYFPFRVKYICFCLSVYHFLFAVFIVVIFYVVVALLLLLFIITTITLGL